MDLGRKKKLEERIDPNLVINRAIDLAQVIFSHPLGIWLAGELLLVALDEKHLKVLDPGFAGQLKTNLTAGMMAYAVVGAFQGMGPLLGPLLAARGGASS